jgi:UV DNA damage endonuclease
VGGVYGDKEKSMLKFIHRFNRLDQSIRRRLVLENDDKSYTLRDCLIIHAKTKTPVLFGSFHHEINSSGETLKQAFELFTKTWKKTDGLPLVDYSSQQTSERKGKHAESIDGKQF